MLRYILLGLLSYRPMSGYDLEGQIKVSTGNFWHAKLSQIYATLKRLEEEGGVVSHIDPQEGRPDRRVYQIMEAGREELRVWLAEPVTEHEVKKDGLLVKVFFHPPEDKESLLAQLRIQLQLHRSKLAEYRQESPEAIQHMIAEQPELASNAVLWEATRRFGEMYEITYIQWLEDTILTVENRLPSTT
ncbi:MAG: PadR family transcriptional regulator [Anaerolineae bacterium]|nr:PadR family transcriptional regulator [Anaerolineae bacterium]